jgi:RNA polymerase sigma factor for flagellar operon FliA
MCPSPTTTYTKTGSREDYIRTLVMEHVPLARSIVNNLSVSLGPTVSRDDLYSAATLGLVEAAHRYDESKGAKFSTFAYMRVRGAVMDCLRRSDWLGKSAREQLKGLRRIVREFRGRENRKPSVEELAEEADMNEETVLKYLSYEKWDFVGSLNDTVGDSDEGSAPLAALIDGGAPTPLENLQDAERLEQLADAIEQLPEREKQIIVMYYYEDLYMAEMAEVFGVSESRISQLHTRAIYNLTRILEADDE